MKISSLETGTVIEVDGNTATVIINKSNSCRECGKAQAGICGKSGEGMIIKVNNTLNAAKGDTVTIGLEKMNQAKGYFFAFALPVLALLAGSYAGHLISASTGIKDMEVITGIACLVLSIACSLLIIHKLDKTARFYTTRIVDQMPALPSLSCPEEADYLAHYNWKAEA